MNETTPARPLHVWTTGGTAQDRQALLATLELPPVLASVSAHRHHRGPWTAGGELVRALVPDVLLREPELVRAHDVEIRVVAPELHDVVPGQRETLTSSAAPQERTRFYPRARTTRIAHGLADLLTAVQQEQGTPRTVVVEDAHAADASDIELLAVLLRRLDPAALRLVVGTAQDVPVELRRALETHAEQVVARHTATDGPRDERAAVQYVAQDCTSQDERLIAAYAALPPGRRTALHDRRAAELEARDEPTLGLGAVPYHLERGSDPRGAGVRALLSAIEHCVLLGFYPAVLELAERSYRLLDWVDDPDRCWLVTAKECTALTALGRPDEAAAQYDWACAQTSSPSVHLQAAYGRAMLHTRFYSPERRDHQMAKAHINTAIAISRLLPEPEQRAFNATFNENGLALIEMHLGDLDASLRLVQAGLDRLEREVGADRFALHRSVLLYNKAQLLTAAHRLPSALEAYHELLDADPHHSEYYFERAGLHRRLGDAAAALADYAEAIRLSPPYPEPHYNRADLALELGDTELARADLDRVLQLDPDHVDALTNRASVLLQLGETGAALQDARSGLALAPESAVLRCLHGQALAESGRSQAARVELARALELDRTLPGVWAAQAALLHEDGDLSGALSALDNALALGDDPALRHNRALVHEAAGHWSAAVSDWTAALSVDDPAPEDRAEQLYRRAGCRLQAGHQEDALRDLALCAASGTQWAAPAAELQASLRPARPARRPA